MPSSPSSCECARGLLTAATKPQRRERQRETREKKPEGARRMKEESLCVSVIQWFTIFTAKAKRRYDGLCVPVITSRVYRPPSKTALEVPGCDNRMINIKYKGDERCFQ